MSRGREAAAYLGYVTLFAAVVVWGFTAHGPRPSHETAASLHLSHDDGARPHLRSGDGAIRRITASMMH
jgi:hypothetical protein